MPATADKYSTIKSWLEKQGSSEPTDGGKPATTGAHAEEQNADAKKLVGADSVVGAKRNPETGCADSMGSATGLKQTTVGKDPENENPSKTVVGEESPSDKVARALKNVQECSDKINNADLKDDAQFDLASSLFDKAASELPILLAAAGMAIPEAQQTQQQKQSSNISKEELEKAASEHQELQQNVERYRQYGTAHGSYVSRYLHGFYNTTALLKQAADDGSLAQMLAAQEAGQGGDPGMGAGGPAGVSPAEAQAAAAAMQGGGGASPGAEGGEMPPDVDDYASAGAEQDLTPEQLEQIIAILKAQVAKEEGGLQPAEKEAVHRALGDAEKVASEVKAHVRSGRFRFKPAADGSPERKRRDAAAGYLNELRKAAG